MLLHCASGQKLSGSYCKRAMYQPTTTSPSTTTPPPLPKQSMRLHVNPSPPLPPPTPPHSTRPQHWMPEEDIDVVFKRYDKNKDGVIK